MIRARAARVSVAAVLVALLTGGWAQPDAAQAQPGAVARAAAEGDCRSIPVEADAPLRADEARDAFGVDGSGVTVGIVSDSYAGSAEAATTPDDDIAAGALPGPGNPCGYTEPVTVLSDAQGADEGRAMAQLVHGIAPGARILFATSGDTVDSYAAAVTALADAGAAVIVDDIGLVSEPVFQKSALSLAIEDVRARGVAYLTAAGNENVGAASDGRPLAGWYTPAYRPMACPDWVIVPDAAPLDCLDFDPAEGEAAQDATDRLRFGEGESPVLSLQWGEPEHGVSSDFELQLYDTVGTQPLLISEYGAVTDDGSAPITSLELPATLGAGEYDLVVVRVAVGDGLPAIRIGPTDTKGDLEAAQYDRSTGPDAVGGTMYGHTVDGSATAVAAAAWDDPFVPEESTAHGPGRLLFEPSDGSDAAAAALPSPVVVAGPAFTSVDGTQTTFFGETVEGESAPRFYGTSAAAPNAAGVIALAKQAAPDLTGDQLLEAAATTAQEMDNPFAIYGVADENVIGAGLLDATALLEEVAGGVPVQSGEPSASAEAAEGGSAVVWIVVAAVLVLAAATAVVLLVLAARRRA